MDKISINSPPFHIGVLLIDDFPLMSYASVVEPIRAANILADKEIYRLSNIPALQERAVSSNGAVIYGDTEGFTYLNFDLVLVVAGGNPSTYRDKAVFAWLRELAQFGVRLGGISGGPVILAAAGLMVGRRMTMHWKHAADLAQSSLLIERGLYVIDRDRVTCAGGTAAIDLMHGLIAEQHGTQFAHLVSDWLLHTDVRPAGGSQRASLIERYQTTNPSIVSVIEVMENRIADPLTLTQLAKLAGLSKRQLNRLFQINLGQSTMTLYREIRLEKARSLVANSTRTLTEIALSTGFSSSAHFCTMHARKFGIPPSTLRKKIK